MKFKKSYIERGTLLNKKSLIARLEIMARKGWLLHEVDVCWVYKKIEPKNLHFSIFFVADADEEYPTPKQRMLYDLCAHGGWELACTVGAMQIFYSEQEDPMPLETEPAVAVDALHATAKKWLLPKKVWPILLSSVMTAFMFFLILSVPLSVLSDRTLFGLRVTFIFLAILVMQAGELLCYFLWYFKARRAAKQDKFIELPDITVFQWICKGLIAVAILPSVVSLLTVRSAEDVALLIYVALIVLLIYTTRPMQRLIDGFFMPKWGRTAIMVGYVLLLVGAGGLALSWGFHWEPVQPGQRELEHVPLKIGDFSDVNDEEYTQYYYGDESFLLGEYKVRNRWDGSRPDGENLRYVEYRCVYVKMPALYDFCKNRVMHETTGNPHALKIEDEKLWGAKEAYQIYLWGDSPINHYVLCYENVIVEIVFNHELTDAQKAIVGEKLGVPFVFD